MLLLQVVLGLLELLVLLLQVVMGLLGLQVVLLVLLGLLVLLLQVVLGLLELLVLLLQVVLLVLELQVLLQVLAGAASVVSTAGSGCGDEPRCSLLCVGYTPWIYRNSSEALFAC